jgi:hypothetical protein
MLPSNVFGRSDTEFASRLCFVDFDGSEALSKIRVESDGTVKEKFFEK